MAEWNFDAGAPEFEALGADLAAETPERIRKWLEREPDADRLTRQLDVLEFALADADHGLRTATIEAVARVAREARVESLENKALGGLVLVQLQAWALTRETRFEEGARRAIRQVDSRWDEENTFFRVSALDTSNVFYTDGNATLGEACYVAWRMLDDQSLRPKAGEVLGRVSDLFDPNTGLYQRQPLPDGAPAGPDWLDAYSAAIGMFVAASRTTERGTYISRACIVANHALGHLEEMRGGAQAQFKFGRVLVGLAVFSDAGQYREKGLEILKRTRAGSFFDVG